MVLLAVLISAVIGFVVGAGVIGREARALGLQRREPVWRLEEAAVFVEAELPVEAAASLDPDTLRQLLRWHLNQLQFERSQAGAPEVSDDRSTSDLYRQARSDGVEITRPEVDAVVAAHLGYLTRIGAMGVADAG
ncbi:MAG: hypothetical protein P8N02_02230 [Actinomycetota bacterium]|nr:hypothetical protein [Actinomycetota bacterium]